MWCVWNGLLVCVEGVAGVCVEGVACVCVWKGLLVCVVLRFVERGHVVYVSVFVGSCG